MCDGIITTVPSFIQLTYQVERCFPRFVNLLFKLVRRITYVVCSKINLLFVCVQFDQQRVWTRPANCIRKQPYDCPLGKCMQSFHCCFCLHTTPMAVVTQCWLLKHYVSSIFKAKRISEMCVVLRCVNFTPISYCKVFYLKLF